MKRFLLATTSAAVLIGMSGTASAQSVLERVLAQTNNVTGIFANTADNIGTGERIVYVDSDGDVFTEAEFEEAVADAVTAAVNTITGNTSDGFQVGGAGPVFATLEEAVAAATADATATTRGNFTAQVIGGAGTIDGSINIIARRIDDATAAIGEDIAAIEGVTTNFGNMSTTVLGAVNTGEIGLGTNQLVEEAIAGSSQAIRSTVEQVGTIADRTQIAVNSALNTMDINGSINIELDGVNASVATITPDQLDIVSGILRDEDGGILGSTGVITLSGLDQLLGSMDTTVLGAVNTGTIVSGVDNQVQGAVAGIIGNSATNMFGSN